MGLQHPKGLYVLFVTEMWERFSYYGMRAIFMLYMVKALLYDNAFASEIYGSYTGLVYLTPLLGGYVADRYWGNRRSIFIGGLLMAAGQFAMFWSASNYTDISIAQPFLFLGLGLLIFGNGFFKPNISTMVGSLYPEGDKRVDSAFTIFYMGINLGAMLSPFICGGLGDTGDPSDFKWGFLAAGIGMVVSVLFFEGLKNKYIVDSNGNPIGAKPAKKSTTNEDGTVTATFSNTQIAVWSVVYIAAILGFFYGIGLDLIGSFIFSTTIIGPAMIITDPSLTKEEKQRIGVIYLVAFFVIFFWAAFEQAGASLTVFADKNTDRNLMGYEVPASFFQAINAAAIVIFAPLFATLWLKLAEKKMEPNSPMKQSIGLLLLSFSYFVIAFGVDGVSSDMKISMMWLVSLYLLQTFGELCLSPIGLSMVNKLAPARFASLLMGVWFLSTASANKFAGTLSALMPVDGPTKFMMFEISDLYDFFMLFCIMSLVAAILLYFINKPLLKMMHGKG